MKPILLDRYKVLIVSHNKSLHNKINGILNIIQILDVEIEILNAHSFEEIKVILESSRDISLVIIDADMELIEDINLIEYVRNLLNNIFVRIIMINQTKELSKCSDTLENRYKKMTTDPLTHLYNRVKLYEACNDNDNKALILIDIIGFSSINDNYGYETGDMVLKEFAAFLFTMYHEDFNVYHLENDLFALTLNAENINDIFNTVKQIQEDILKLNIITNSFNKTLDISIGVACQSENNILRRAELALKEARSIGINKIQYYSEDLKILKKLKNTNYWGPIIKDALKNDDIVVNYQPIYDLKTKQIEKYELLMRLVHEGEEYLPAKFLDAAHDTGQMYDIFKYMFSRACYLAEKKDMKFSVNIGDTEFEYDDIIDFITGKIEVHKINPALLSLEILEYNSIGNNTVIKDKIIKIHELGVRIAIDDFGIHCSNFGQMQDLPIDIIKIDGSFIKNLPESENSKIVVKTIQTYAKEKKIKLVAEYVCAKNVLENILELGIEYGQGYYLCEPLNEEEFLSTLDDRV